MLHARVAVPIPLGQAFTYSIPSELERSVIRGARVLCEFGRRKVLGVVIETGGAEPDIPEERIKPIQAVVDTEPVLPEELLGFLLELSRYYLAPVGEVMRLALPAVERGAAERLEQSGLLAGTRVAAVGKLVQIVEPVSDVAGTGEPRGQARDVLSTLRETGAQPVAGLQKRFSNARAAVKRLEKLGLVRVVRRPAASDPFFAGPAPADCPPELTPAQKRAVEAILPCLEHHDRGAFLLHGVTASGKTEVYLRAVARCLELGKSSIVLVPEIALTPQLVARFRARLGESIAVLHSGLSPRDRHAMWKSLRLGELRVAIGARSALFAPVDRLGLVCVDEEHDPSFKQEEGVRYHARDMALLRAHRAGATAVLGSATPSLSSEALVRSGKLEALLLPERARRTAALPRIEVVDLRRMGPGPTGERLLSLPLHRELERILAEKEQAILFLNRRGFSPSLVCDDCGKVTECPNCSVALTLHRARGDELVCHYCDFYTRSTDRCSECGSHHLAREGAGTERIEAALGTAFPSARIGRLDRDVAAGLKSEKILERMRSGQIDILVGTQMVAKGHDLPAVTLVGVLNADASLSMPDFQASERTFHLLVQVAGRAGRGDSPGVVLIQTRNPTHPAIELAVRHDVRGFMDRELVERRELGYPPFCHIALLRVDAVDERLVRAEAERLCRIARQNAPRGVGIVGPAPAPIARVRNRYRFRFLVRAASRKAVRETVRAVVRAGADRRVRLSADIDPVNMM